MGNRILSLMLLLCCIHAAATTTWAEDEKARELDPVVVRERMANEPPDSPFHLPESSMDAVWSIDCKGIESIKPRDIFDVLSYAPGVQLSFQGRKGMNFIGARGGNFIGGSGYAILVDGVYVPWTQSSRMLSSFPVDAIDTIRVVRDSTILSLAPLTGLGSMGTAVQGVVLIETRKPEKDENRVKASYGNLNRSKVFLNHAGRFDEAYYSLNYNRLHVDGCDDWNNASHSDSLLLKGGYGNDGLTADASFYYDWASREIQRATSASKTADSKWEYDPLDTLMAAFNASKKWNVSQTTALGLYTGRVDTAIHYRSYSKPSYSESEQEDNVVQADLHHIVLAGGHNFRIGGQAIFWDCPDGQFYYEGIEREEELYSGYLHDEYRLNRSWRMDAGARIDYRHIEKGVDKYSPTDPTPTVLIEDEWLEPYYGASVGTAYRFDEVWEATFRVGYTRQGADSYLATEDDETLEAEKQWRCEAGLAAAFHPALRAAVTGFYYDIDDMKQTAGSVPSGKDIVSVYGNADTVRKGLELEVDGYVHVPDFWGNVGTRPSFRGKRER